MKVPMTSDANKELRKLPSVDHLLKQDAMQVLVQQYGHDLTVTAIQEILAQIRLRIQQGQTGPAPQELPQQVAQHLDSLLRPSLYPVINATGVIIHTNLGRSPLSASAQAAMLASSEYCNLEYDLEAGERSSRYLHAEGLLCRLTGAEAGLVVNNDAAAVLLILTVLAQNRQAIISRGELVEVGGGFRIPEVMAQSGAQLVEVGTTNRTYARDYAAAIGPQSAILLHVHTSNFRLVGFVEQTPLHELVTLAQEHGLLCVDDLGSGALLDTAQFGLSHEPMVQESLAAGVDLVCFSGDKLLGGPQAGIILGKERWVSLLKQHPLTRALRVSKTILTGLQATLLHYQKNEALQHVPIWQMIAADLAHIELRATALATWLGTMGIEADIVDGSSAVGGGSLPGETIPTRVVAVHVDAPQELAHRLRVGSPPVIGRVESGSLMLDLRTVLLSQEQGLRQAMQAAL
jgi:L-seryl-tRNA(Ser) seleniumtransferase